MVVAINPEVSRCLDALALAILSSAKLQCSEPTSLEDILWVVDSFNVEDEVIDRVQVIFNNHTDEP